jgi:hypothetical protein
MLCACMYTWIIWMDMDLSRESYVRVPHELYMIDPYDSTSCVVHTTYPIALAPLTDAQRMQPCCAFGAPVHGTAASG